MKSPLFNVLTCALLHPPPASSRALRVAPMFSSRWTNPDSARSAVVKSETWTAEMLQPALHPGPSVPFVALPREYGYWDVVRAAWLAPPFHVHIAQARHLAVIRLAGARVGSDVPPCALAQELARRIFRMPEAITFVARGRFRGGVYGEQDPASGPPQSTVGTHWHDVLSWWAGRDDIAFVTIKNGGGMPREIPMPDQLSNRDWFED